ncbi:MAG: hypothetical protein HY698_01825 [Deltaproteobacteria bacterium]|nr:hypothetical protein [Deltaproteobacteria bacterium]
MAQAQSEGGPEDLRFLDGAGSDIVPARLLGGKAANLLALTREGFPVPAWFCVTTKVFKDLWAPIADELERVMRDLDVGNRAAIRDASTRLQERIRASGLASADREALMAHFDAASFPAGALVAVRSSVVGEDSAKDSFAGQMDTYLYVTRETLLARVVDCFASAFSERALLYRRLRGLETQPIEAAVVVQQMVDSRVSGILFTANPTSGDTTEAVVSAGLGLGEGIVGGLVESDTYFLDLESGRLRDRKVVEKRSRVVVDPTRGSGTCVAEVSKEEGNRPALDEEQLHALLALGRKVQALRGVPQDIEWAFDSSARPYLLQARPITTLGRERESIFDNANVVESYPGLSSPLTFTFARKGYEITFREFSRSFGVPERLLEEAESVHANLVGLVDGRIYYNILNWYRFAGLVPGFEWSLEAWEKALGLKHRYVRPVRRSLWEKLRVAPLVGRVAWRMLAHFVRLDRNVERFQEDFGQVLADFQKLDLAALEAHALLDLYERISRSLLAPYAISVINDSYTQQLHELLGKLVARFNLGDPAALRNDLLCGERGLESVEPVRSVLALTARIRQDEPLRALFGSEVDDATAWRRVREEPSFQEFSAELDEHIRRYGDRTLHELKLETPTLEENPGFLIAMLRNYLRGGQAIELMERREDAIRERAEKEVAGKLSRRPLRRWLFGWVLRRLRAGVKHRENLRLARSRGFGMVKRIFRQLGRILAAGRLLDSPGDVFWLAVDEVFGVVRGHAVTRDLKALVALRKREYASFAERRPAPRITTLGVVALANCEPAVPEHADDAVLLRGLGCSPGVAKAPAKVIFDPSCDLTINGEILVAPMTDPGWVYLMVASGGIVSEKGSLLSHTAIIGRELGIPTVVGAKDATRRIRSGQSVEIDGQAGTVRLLPEEEGSSR